MKRLLITVNGKRYEVEVEVVQDDDALEPVPPPRAPVRSSSPGPVAALPPARPREGRGDPKALTSPINGTVLEIPVSVGQVVNENDVLFVLEAMKMKTNIASPQAGRVKSILVKVGDRIDAEQLLLEFD